MSKLINVKGNILYPQKIYGEDEFIVIPHCCNTLGIMGAGVALFLKKECPKGVKPYFDAAQDGLQDKLGEVYCGWQNDYTIIANMIGQNGIRSADNPKPVKYVALVKAMSRTLSYAKKYAFRRSIVFHCCKFGSDLAGGNFDLILELIEEIWVDNGFDVVIYEFEPDREKWGPIE